MKTNELISEAISLPIEERAFVVDSILRSFQMPDSDVDANWVSVAKHRLADLRSEKVRSVPGDEVFAKISKRLSS